MKNKEILTFRMHARIKFNREIDADGDYISPGGYTNANADTQQTGIITQQETLKTKVLGY